MEKPPPPPRSRRRLVPPSGPRAREDEETKVPCPVCRTGLVSPATAAEVPEKLRRKGDVTP